MTHDTARNSYNRLSRWYDVFSGSEDRLNHMGLQKLAVGVNEKVLEIGSGTGNCLVEIAQCVGAQGIACGIDLAEGMLAVAGKKLAGAGAGSRAGLVRGDAIRLPFAAGSFDVVFLSFTLELFAADEIPVVLGECARVLRDASRLGIVAMADESNPGMVSRLYGWAHQQFPGVIDCRPIRVEKVLEDAGFFIQETSVVGMWGLPVAIILAKKNSQ
jgi:ubiquinone/menaquinone biosynthesis C-methylase UbiE